MKKYLIASAALLCLITAFVLKTLNDAGEFKKITPHFDGTVRLIPGITGGEDITIDHEKRIAYLSADDRFAILKGKEGFGALYAIYLDSPDVAPKLLKRTPASEIHPHGISYYKSAGGPAYLYVVDHATHHAILLFQFMDDTTLVLLREFRNPEFIISPNDVAAVDERHFYFTNDHGSRTHRGRLLEDYLQLKKSNVIYFDGFHFSVAATSFAHCNGININKAKNEVYVASTIGKNISIYKRADNGTLAFWKEIPLDTGVDNIELDEHENLWVACHPKLLTFVKHANDTSRPAPSQVIRITRDENDSFIPAEIFMNEGKQVSASSVAAVAGNTLLIGAVLDGNLLWCEMR